MQFLFHFLLTFFFQQKGLCKLINATGYRINLMFNRKPFSVLNCFWLTFLCMVLIKLERSWVCFCLLRIPKHLAHFCLTSLICEEQTTIFCEPKEFFKISVSFHYFSKNITYGIMLCDMKIWKLSIMWENWDNPEVFSYTNFWGYILRVWKSDNSLV